MVAAVLALIFSGLLGFFSAVEIKKKKDRNLKRALVLLFLFCCSLGFGIYDLLNKETSSSEQNKEVLQTVGKVSDSTKGPILDSLSKTEGRIIDTVIKYHSGIFNSPSHSEALPLLELPPLTNEDNPKFQIINKDSALCQFNIYNLGNDQAKNLKDYIVVLNYIQQNPNIWDFGRGHNLNKSVILYPNGINGITLKSWFINDDVLPRFSYPVYVYLKLDYTNSANKPMIPMRRIYELKQDGFHNVNSLDYEKVEQDLKKKGVY